jgi:N-acetylglucosamine-6-phosphate deacetylase
MEVFICRHAESDDANGISISLLYLLMQTAYSAAEIFTGDEWLQDHAIIVEDHFIQSLLPLSQLPSHVSLHSYQDKIMVPSFVDVQVYGAAGKLFSLFPSVDTLKLMEESFASTGTFLFQPTVATNTTEVIKNCIDAIRDYKNGGGTAVHGLHVEGPWLNAYKKGAHLAHLIHAPEENEVKEILQYGEGIITMITLAPEICTREVIDIIRSYNVIISAGHSNAGFEEATKSFNGGINVVTHLFNAMSGFHHREPGLAGAVFLHEKVNASVIPDGHHVSYDAIAIAKKIMRKRLFAITDAVTDTSEGPYRHKLVGDRYECNDTLSGSALSMYQAFYNLVTAVGIDKGEAHRMCSLYPAQVLGTVKNGKMEPGFHAQMLVLDKQLNLVDVLS